ncbi:Sialic acid TRAP transporter large permease protein SiaM [subsurface metagenome]
MVYFLAKTKRVKLPSPRKFSIKEFLNKLKIGIAGVGAPVIILTGIVTGFVTPTEAGILATFYALIVWIITEIIDKKNISFREYFKKIKKILINTTIMSSLIMFLLALATPLVWTLTRSRSIISLSEMLFRTSSNPIVILILINIVLLIAGTILNQLPALLLLVPMLLPLAKGIGMNPVHFGVMMVFNLMIGMITPPFGVGLFIMVKIADVKIPALVRACFPFFIALLFALFFIAVFPIITLWLPSILL